MHQLPGRLFTPAIDSISVVLNHTISEGWRLSVAHRHSGEGWQRCSTDRYEYLTSSEACDTLDAVVLELLGCADAP
jgi:hypothetical protein